MVYEKVARGYRAQAPSRRLKWRTTRAKSDLSRRKRPPSIALSWAIVKRAKDKKYKDLGIIYRHLSQNAGWRLACVHDASSASQGHAYVNEGIMVFLTVDRLNLDGSIHEIDGYDPQIFGGPAHLLWAQGGKAKRISYSTSHGETLAAINGLESSSLVSLRLGELLMPDSKPSLAQLAALQEGVPFLPVDVYTDCRDFYELTTGVKAMPQDKGQRIYIMAHRSGGSS